MLAQRNSRRAALVALQNRLATEAERLVETERKLWAALPKGCSLLLSGHDDEPWELRGTPEADQVADQVAR